MPTLSELAKTQQTTTVGAPQASAVGSAGGTSIQPTQQIDKTAALTADIGKMFGGLVQEHQVASEYAGKRVGTDNLVAYKNRMGEIAKLYNRTDLTSADMVEKTRNEQGAYEKYMQKGHFADNEIANQAFKDNYVVPATNDLFKTKESNLALKNRLFVNEETLAIQSEMTATSGTYTEKNIRGWQERLVAIGKDPQLIWGETAVGLNAAFTDKFNDGMDSNALISYLDNGVLTQEGLDKVFNDTYGAFVTRTNGVFSRVYKDMGYKSYKAMKKSFNGWIDSFAPKKGTTPAIDATILKSVNNLTITMSDNVLNNSDKELTRQMREVATACTRENDKACAKLPRYRDSQVSLAVIKEKKLFLDTKLKAFTESDINDVGILNSAGEIAVTVKSFSKFKEVQMPSEVKVKEVHEYVHSHFNNQLSAVLNSSEVNIDAANGLAKKVGSLQNGSISGSATASANNAMRQVSNMANITKSQTAGQLLNNLQFAVTYKAETGNTSYKGLTKRTLAGVEQFYDELLKRQEQDPSLTDSMILGKLKIMTSANINSSAKTAHKRTTEALAEMGLKDGDEADTVLSGEFFGWKIGEGVFTDGSLDIALDGMKESGISYTNVESVQKGVRGRMLVLDKSILPIWGTSLAVVKPTMGKVTDSELITNLIDVMKFKLGQNAKLLQIDFKDLVDETDKIQIRQVDDGINGLQTIAEVIDNGVIVSRAIIDDGEWIKGIDQERKTKMNESDKKLGLSVLFENSGGN